MIAQPAPRRFFPASTRIGSDRALLFVTGYLAILLPTMIAKYASLTSLYRGGLAAVLKSVLAHPTRAELVAYRVGFFCREILELFGIWAVLFLILASLFRSRLRYAVTAAVFAAMLVIGANSVSFAQLQTFVTIDTIGVSLNWIASNPGILRSFVEPRALAFLPLITIWSAVPWVLVARLPRDGTVVRMVRSALVPVLCMIAAASACLLASTRLIPTSGPLPIWGYWSGTAAALFQYDRGGPEPAPVLSLTELRQEYEQLVYPSRRPEAGSSIISLDAASLRPRHIVVIVLETAPRSYYPILDNPGMPGFYGRRDNSIVSDLHYTPRPYTTWADYAILSGTYPQLSRGIGRPDGSGPDGLAAILAGHGYLTTYIDSYRIDWHGGDRHRTMWKDLGFQTLIDTTNDPVPTAADSYQAGLEGERLSLRRAREAVLEAERKHTKAFVFVGTLFGHFDWKARPGDESLPAKERVLRNCRALDALIGEFVAAMEADGLRDEFILVVTGDHGLRNEAEFASLGETMMVGPAAFNVPLAIYAPGILRAETRLPYATSHIDLAPTLLELTGLGGGGSFFLGESMLNTRLRDRVLFQFNSGLSPTDGYLWHDRFFTANTLTGMVEIGRDAGAGEPSFDAPPADRLAEIPEDLIHPKLVLERARGLFGSLARYFAERRGGAPGKRSTD